MTNPFKDYRITSPFGWRIHPISKKKEFHTGIDLVKGHQSPIYAFMEGEVLYAGMGKSGTGLGGYGNVVVIKDKYGRAHVYAHLDSALVKKGTFVEKGQVIGRQGNTGQSTGSHLHYEVRKGHSPSYGWIADRANNCFEPTEYLKKYAVKKESEKKVSGTKPNWAEWQWKEAEETYRKAREKGIITSDMWEKKAANKELTFDDIAFLNLVLNGRVL